MEAVGILEVYGLVCALLSADAGCKAGDVRLEDFDRNRPASFEGVVVPLLVVLKFRGAVADVEMAMAAAEEVAEGLSGVASRHIIAAPHAELEATLKQGGFDPR